jgi:hypothetical protein
LKYKVMMKMLPIVKKMMKLMKCKVRMKILPIVIKMIKLRKCRVINEDDSGNG